MGAGAGIEGAAFRFLTGGVFLSRPACAGRSGRSMVAGKSMTGLMALLTLAIAAPACSPRGAVVSPDSDPPCALPVPSPPTPWQIAAERVRPQRPLPPLPPATAATPVHPNAVSRHICFLEVAGRGSIQLLFVGDSITDFFGREDRGRAVWNANYAPLHAANFGIAGDTTQGALWRMRNGELEGFKARLIVLMLGTNNIGRNSNEDIVAGNAAILAEFRKRQPDAKILLLGIFPRGDDPANPDRATVREINQGLAKLADGKSVFYLDIGPHFLNADGTMIEGAMVDGLHPGPKGYEIWAAAMAPMVRKLMP